MKFKTIARLCAQSKTIFIYDKKREDESVEIQWIGDGCAMYPAFDLPYLEEDSIYAMFDIPEKNRNKYIFRHEELPKTIPFQDAAPCENVLDSGKLELLLAGRNLKPLQTQRGLVFIDSKYLSPLADAEESLELYERITSDGRIYIAAKTGFMVMAIISPYDIISPKFVKQMEELTDQCRFALQNAENRDKQFETE